MEELILIGAGGHGKDVCDAALAQGRAVVGFVDDNPGTWGTAVLERPVLGGLAWLLGTDRRTPALITISNPRTKLRIDEQLRTRGISIALPVVHPAAYVSRHAEVEDGAVVLAGAAVQAGARVERHAYVHTASSVSHDVKIEAYSSLHPGVQVGGGARIERGCFVGIGAAILPGVRVGEWTTVGAGAVVLRDLPARVTAVGVPARILRER